MFNKTERNDFLKSYSMLYIKNTGKGYTAYLYGWPDERETYSKKERIVINAHSTGGVFARILLLHFEDGLKKQKSELVEFYDNDEKKYVEKFVYSGNCSIYIKAGYGFPNYQELFSSLGINIELNILLPYEQYYTFSKKGK